MLVKLIRAQGQTFFDLSRGAMQRTVRGILYMEVLPLFYCFTCRQYPTILLVYDLGTQNLSFVAPTTMHFPEVSGDIYYTVIWPSGGLTEMHCGGFSCPGMGATNLNSKGPTHFRS